MTSAIFLAPAKIRGAGLATFGLAGAGAGIGIVFGKRYLNNGYDRFTDDTDFGYIDFDCIYCSHVDFDDIYDELVCCYDCNDFEYDYTYSYFYTYKYDFSYTYKNHCNYHLMAF